MPVKSKTTILPEIRAIALQMLIIEAKIPSDNANIPHIFADWYLEFLQSFNSEIPDAWKYAIIAAMLAKIITNPSKIERLLYWTRKNILGILS